MYFYSDKERHHVRNEKLHQYDNHRRILNRNCFRFQQTDKHISCNLNCEIKSNFKVVSVSFLFIYLVIFLPVEGVGPYFTLVNLQKNCLINFMKNLATATASWSQHIMSIVQNIAKIVADTIFISTLLYGIWHSGSIVSS